MHQFPADGEYKFSLTLYYYYLEQFFGGALPANLTNQQIEVSVDGEPVYTFTIDPKTKETQANYVTPPGGGKGRTAPRVSGVPRKGDGPIVDTIELYAPDRSSGSWLARASAVRRTTPISSAC